MKNTKNLLKYVTLASALAAGCSDDLNTKRYNERDYRIRDSSVDIQPQSTIPVTDAYVPDCRVGDQRVIENDCEDGGIRYQECEEYLLDNYINEPVRDWGFGGVKGDMSPCYDRELHGQDSNITGNGGYDAGVIVGDATNWWDAGVDNSDATINDSGLIAEDLGMILDSNPPVPAFDSAVLPDARIDANIMECLDGDLEEQCCEVLGRQERLCDNGAWARWSDCEVIDPADLDFVNLSNNGAQDNSPSISGDKVAFISGRNGASQVYLVRLNQNQPNPQLISNALPRPSDQQRDCDSFINPDCEWSTVGCSSTPSLSGNQVAFVCGWMEADVGLGLVWSEADAYPGFLYKGTINDQNQLIGLNRPLDGFNPSLSGRAFAYDWGNVQIYDLVNGGAAIVEAGAKPNANGDYVVFESSRNNFPTGKEIYSRNLAEGVPAINISQSREIDDNKPTISEEGVAVWSSNIPLEGSRIMLYNAQDGLQARRLTDNGFDERNPVIDGSLVVFEGGRQGSTDLYVVDLETGVQMNLTESPQNNNNSQPSLSDGRLAFTSDRTGNNEVFVVDLLGNRCEE